MGHVSSTHRVDLECFFFFDRVNLDATLSIRHVNTKEHMADILTLGSFTLSQWTDLIQLIR